jgi:putative PEP-CTERM system histidine kinase
LAAVIAELLYLGCALTFLGVSALVLLRGRTSRTGVAIVACCLLSAGWAAAAGLPLGIPDGVVSSLNGLRLSAWLLLVVGIMALPSFRARRHYIFGAAALAAATVGYDVAVPFIDPSGAGRHPIQLLLRLCVGVAGLLAVENLWRNTAAERRWHLRPLCLAVGSLFAFDLFLYADAFMNRRSIDPGLALGQPMVGIAMAPLLLLAMARNREWKIDVHVSRQLVLHTATLIASGCFLIAVAIAGALVRGLGSDWGPPVQLAMLIGSVFVLAVVLSSETPRRRLNRLISRNLFSHRYDYRVEWLKFIDLVSDPAHVEELQVRIIRALAGFVDSPAGALWSGSGEAGYHLTAAWKPPGGGEAKLPPQHPFIAGFRGGGWIQERPGDERAAEPWQFAGAAAWLAVPLSHGGDLVGFVILNRPRHAAELDWESFDLLRAAGRQAASYLAEERSTRALLDAALLNDYAKRFAFVIHDIKNLASQLGLTVTNARRYIDNPEFRRDMLDTIEDAAARMHHLLGRLKAEPADEPTAPLYPRRIIADVVASFALAAAVVEDRADDEDCPVTIDAEQLRSALTHLVQNAIDASPPGERVVVRTRRRAGALVIEVIDHGVGMDAEFVRDELFKPFRSTKLDGHGIGAFQTRELLRQSGGDLEVISTKGAGTTMRIVLPLAAAPQPAGVTAVA